jgi:ornithine--oxo-acid transaminase
MAIDIAGLFRRRLGENYRLHADHINPTWARVTHLIGYDKVYARAEGCSLYDTAGRRYLDCVSGFCVSSLGHNHPAVRRALVETLQESFPNLIQLDCALLPGLLAEALLKRIPWLERVYFSSSGSEAIESAIKFARCATGRPRILYADGSYHGVTYGALSVTGHDMWKEGFGPLLPGTTAIPFNDSPAIERELARGDVAGVLLEPIQVGAGILLPEEGYFTRVQELCRKRGALMMFDEIHTGVGRTGTFLAAEHWNVEPDIVCLSKGLSGGLVPVSATLTRAEIFRKVYSRLDRSMVHATTFGGNNLAMVAGLATLQVLDDERLLERCREMGEFLMTVLRPLKEKYELVKDVRGKGLLVGIEFGEPKSLFLRNAWKMMHTINPGLFAQAFTLPLLDTHAILTQVAGHNEDVLKVAPAFVVTREEIERLARALDEVLGAAHSFPGPFWEVGSRLAKNALLA